MFYQLSKNQSVFIEITNKVHGGEGWEFSTCLWSPERSRDNKDTWSKMRNVKKGSLIIHSLKTSKGHMFAGASIAYTDCKITDIEPPAPGKWYGYREYYRIELDEYKSFEHKIYMKDFLKQYETKIKDISGSFFTNEKSPKPAQKYLVELSQEVIELLFEFFNSYNIKYTSKLNSGENDKSGVQGNETPERIKTIIMRKIRDTKITGELKLKYEYKCQVCGKVIILPNKKYAEGHHLKPLGRDHNGPDTKDNIIILCPYHHTEFDYGAIALKPDSNDIIHIDKNNEYHGKKLYYERIDLNKEFIKYHYRKIFNKKI